MRKCTFDDTRKRSNKSRLSRKRSVRRRLFALSDGSLDRFQHATRCSAPRPQLDRTLTTPRLHLTYTSTSPQLHFNHSLTTPKMKANPFRTHDQHYCSASKSSVSIAYAIVTARRALEPTGRIQSALLTICFSQPWRRLSLSSPASLIESTTGSLASNSVRWLKTSLQRAASRQAHPDEDRRS